jgi:hypothetical protein
MKKTFDKLDKSFNIENSEVKDVSEISVEVEVVKEKPNKNYEEDISKDYEYTRGNLYSLIEKGQEAINGILELAHETEMPRAYEVAGQIIKNVADATDKLIDLQKKIKELEEVSPQKGPTNVTNALFVGSTAELAKLLKQNKVEQIDE